MKNITLKQLRAFVSVADEGSFTKAAAKLHVTQSTLTSSIKQIENEIGLRLFERTTREVALTKEGSVFLPVVQRTISDLEAAVDGLRKIVDHEKGSVVVAGAGSFINYVLSPAILQMANQYPGISFRLAEEPTKNVVEMVLSGEADFGVTTLLESNEDIEVLPLLSDCFCAVFSSDHVLSRRSGSLRWKDLEGMRSIKLHHSSGIRALLNKQVEFARLTKETAYEVGLASSLNFLLKAGFGYSVVPAMTARHLQNDGIQFRLITEPSVFRTFTAIKRKGKTLSPAAVTLFKKMIENMKEAEEEPLIQIKINHSDIEKFCKWL